MLKPIRLIGGCAAIVAISLVIIYWMVSDEGERLNIRERITNKASEPSLSERNNISINRNTNTSDRNGAKAVMNSEEAEEMIGGMTRSELDAFHENQMMGIRKALAEPNTRVQLPPSADQLPRMTLRELDELHKQQMMSLTRESLEIVQPAKDGATEARNVIMSPDELDLMHTEQVNQSRLSVNDVVELPLFMENGFRPLNVGQLDEMISRQTLAAEFSEVDDKKPIVLPPSSDGSHTMTNWDLIELHEKQMRQLTRQPN